jgi:PKD repeat protein
MISEITVLARRARLLLPLFAAAIVPVACADEQIMAPHESAIPYNPSASAAACIAPPADLIAWWRGEGDANDVTGQHHGVVRGSVAFSAGMVGSTPSFNGASGHLEIADAAALDFTTALTVEAWVNPADVTSILVPIIAKWDDNTGNFRTYFLTLQSGRLRFSISENGLYDQGAADLFSPSALQAGVWQHVAATYDGTNMRLYINGQLAAERATPIRSLFANDRPLLIGAGYVGGSPLRYFSGSIDEPAVYNRALTAAEIGAIHAAGSSGKCYTPQNKSPVARVGGPYSGNEGASIALALSGTDPDGDALTYTWDLGDGTTGNGSTPPAAHRYGDDGTYAVTLIVSDSKGARDTASTSVAVANVAPVLGPIMAPTYPVAISGPVVVSADFTDAGVLDVHSAVIDWDANGTSTTSAGTVTESNGAGTVSGSRVYTTPGVYFIRITVRDDEGASASAVFQYVVVYEPNEQGFVTGGGWIDSPAGAYPADPLAEGRATFGFVSRAQYGGSRPTGTQFQFRTANFDFRSATWDWLIIAGAKAQYKGSGTINDSGDYSFILTVNDGQISGGGGVDRIRIKIWNKATGAVIYDNQMGNADNASASQAIGAGSIVIHR